MHEHCLFGQPYMQARRNTCNKAYKARVLRTAPRQPRCRTGVTRSKEAIKQSGNTQEDWAACRHQCQPGNGIRKHMHGRDLQILAHGARPGAVTEENEQECSYDTLMRSVLEQLAVAKTHTHRQTEGATAVWTRATSIVMP
jgi:hypothetical protein